MNFRDGGPKGYTSLMYAIMHGYLEITKELLQRGADVNAIAVNDEVQLDVVVAVAQAEAAHREIGTPQNSLFYARCRHIIHLPV